MIRRSRCAPLVFAVLAPFAATLLGSGCGSSGSDDALGPTDGSTGAEGSAAESGAGDSAGDGSRGADAALESSRESGAGDGSDAAATDGGGDANPGAKPHRVFVTSAAYTGNLVGQANALVGAGIPAPDGGTFGPGDFRGAANALCQRHADKAGLAGTYWAILDAWQGGKGGPSNFFKQLTDADGPWALPNGQAVANLARDLEWGWLHVAVDVTELGTPYPYDREKPGQAAAWVPYAAQGMDCAGWTAAGSDGGSPFGRVGGVRYTGAGWLDISFTSCSVPHPLYCLQVGTGGGSNAQPPPPAGAKIAFLTRESYPTTFAQPSDAGAGADAVHASADSLCAESAASAGLSGTFRAFISSSSSSAKDYFAAKGLDGPWYRPDGVPIADGRADLFRQTLTDGGTASSGLHNQIELDAAGQFNIQTAMTGTNADGTTGPNCNDFGAGAPVDGGNAQTRACLSIFKDWEWASHDLATCSALTKGALYCFQQ